MKYAVISDIHANLEALTAVLDATAAHRVHSVVCLGDLVGYHANPNECIQVIQTRNIPSVRGNHDAVAARLKEPDDFSETARHSILWTRQQLTTHSLQMLATLPMLRVIDNRFLMVHAALHPLPNETVRLHDEQQAAETLRVLAADYPGINLCFFGHTHRAVAYESHAGRILRLDGPLIHLKDNARYLVNPGSVGQSRSRDPRAAFLLFDATQQTIQFCRVPYDRRACDRRARQAGLIRTPGLVTRSAAWLWRRFGPASTPLGHRPLDSPTSSGQPS